MDHILYHTAKIAFDKGFWDFDKKSNPIVPYVYINEDDIGWALNSPLKERIYAPTNIQFQTWMREEYGIIISPYPILMSNNKGEIEQSPEDIEYTFMLSIRGISINVGTEYHSWNEALAQGLLLGVDFLDWEDKSIHPDDDTSIRQL